MPTPSWTVSFTMPTASNSPAKACAGHEANRTRRLDQPPSPMTQIHRPARLATRAASFRYGGRHHSGIPGDIIPLYPGDFVGIRMLTVRIQVIDGTGTFTQSDSQPCRLLTSLHGHYPTSPLLRSSPPLSDASVLSASRGHRLCLFPWHRRPGSQVPQ